VSEINITLLTFATEKFENSQSMLQNIARGSGWNCLSYNPSRLLEIDPGFYSRPASNTERGFGLWTWKPMIILHELKKLKANEVLFYIDAGDLFLPNIVDVYQSQLASQPCLLFEGGGSIREYTKRSTLEAFGMDGFRNRNRRMIEAGVSFWKNNSESLDILTKWQESCQNFSLISDPALGESQFSNFIAHRHDQSILTLLALKLGLSPISASRRRSFQCNVMEK
jgi:hypothetical protein